MSVKTNFRLALAAAVVAVGTFSAATTLGSQDAEAKPGGGVGVGKPIGGFKPIGPVGPIGPVKPPKAPFPPIGPIGPVKPPVGPKPPHGHGHGHAHWHVAPLVIGAGTYVGSCYWLAAKYEETGSRYWLKRYYECIGY